jgi:hypothetical protein
VAYLNISTSTLRKGTAVSVLSSASYAGMVVFLRYAYQTGILPGTAVFLRFAVASAALILTLTLTRRWINLYAPGDNLVRRPEHYARLAGLADCGALSAHRQPGQLALLERADPRPTDNRPGSNSAGRCRPLLAAFRGGELARGDADAG